MNLEKYIKFTPIVGALIIFFGFLSQHYYYGKFNISIFSYLTTGEIILSFLPFINTILIAIFGLCLLLSIAILRKRTSKVHIKNHSYWTLFKIYRLGRFRKILKLPEILFGLLIELVSFILKDILWVVLLIIISIEFYNKEFYKIDNIGLKLGLLAFVMKKYTIDELYKKVPVVYKDVINGIFIFFVLYVAIVVSSFLPAERILKDEKAELTNISFVFQEKIISTNDTIVFIGDTHDYIFLRNIPGGINYIYSRDKISEYQIKR